MLNGQEALLTNITRMVSPTSAFITGPTQTPESERQQQNKSQDNHMNQTMQGHLWSRADGRRFKAEVNGGSGQMSSCNSPCGCCLFIWPEFFIDCSFSVFSLVEKNCNLFVWSHIQEFPHLSSYRNVAVAGNPSPFVFPGSQGPARLTVRLHLPFYV